MERLQNIQSIICPHDTKSIQNRTDINDLYQKVYNKSQKYYHLKDEQSIKEALVNEKLFGLIPRLQINDEALKNIPEDIKDYIINLKEWAIMKDGQGHKELRSAFPTDFMVYSLTKNKNYYQLKEISEYFIEKAFKKSAIINVKNDISNEVAISLLIKIFGFKNISNFQKDKLILWSERSADTGKKYPLDENAVCYKEAHQFFIEIIDEIEQAIINKDSTKYDLDGLIGKMIKEKKIVDKHVMANQCNMWLLGGSHNPSNMISLSVGLLLQHKEQFKKLQAQLKKDPHTCQQMMHQVVNEVLRFLPPAHVIVRTASEDLTLRIGNDQVKINKNDSVILHLQESSRNQNIQNNQEFNIFREKTSHLGFGYGPHRCMGGETGQLQAEVVLEKLLFADILEGKHHLANVELVEFQWENSGSFKEIHSLKIRYNTNQNN